MFNENGQDSKYWGSSPGLSTTALSYIPENVWNESCTVAQCGSSNANIAATGGGASAFFTKPSWQTGVSGIPAANARNLPDISLTASLGDPYLLCFRQSCEQSFILFIGGTSSVGCRIRWRHGVVNQKMGGRQGQANDVLYKVGCHTEFLSRQRIEDYCAPCQHLHLQRRHSWQQRSSRGIRVRNLGRKIPEHRCLRFGDRPWVRECRKPCQ